jgi:hypothetical protein
VSFIMRLNRIFPAGFLILCTLSARAVLADGLPACWGAGESGYGGYNFGQSAPPTGLLSLRMIDAGGFHTVAVLPSGQVICWGRGFIDS